jgi:hypothetical protein
MPSLSPADLAGLIVVASFAAGLNVYATIATLGVLSRLDVVGLPAPLQMVGDPWVIGVCVVLFAIEAVADKVPAFDLIWNALQTVVRVPVGAYLAYAAAAPLSPGVQLAAATIGGAIALAAHTAKTTARVAVTASPEPVSNIVLSAGEDGLAIALTWFATSHPFIAAAIVVGLLVLIAVFARWMIRALKKLWRVGAAA